MALIQAMIAKHTFKLTTFQAASSYCATLGPQLLKVIMKLTKEGGWIETLATASKGLSMIWHTNNYESLTVFIVVIPCLMTLPLLGAINIDLLFQPLKQ